MIKPTDPTVIISGYDIECSTCKNPIQKKSFFQKKESDSECLTCAKLNHLIFLPSGDTALSRRARKHSTTFAIVQEWSKSRKRYERQGILIEKEALDIAEQECKRDIDKRKLKQAKDAIKREEDDKKYIKQFSLRIKEMFPSIPSGIDQKIAEHACEKYSGRVGRSASAKQLNEKEVTLAVRAYIRHSETDYDRLLGSSYSKREAREMVRDKIDEVVSRWKNS